MLPGIVIDLHEHLRALDEDDDLDLDDDLGLDDNVGLDDNIDLDDELDVDEEGGGEPQVPYVRTGPKVGRNDPCPCGSGKK